MRKSVSLFSFSLVSAVLLSVFYHDRVIGYTLLYSLIILFVCSAISAVAAPSSLRITIRQSEHTVFRGQTLTLRASIRNKWLLPYASVRIKQQTQDPLLEMMLPTFEYSPAPFSTQESTVELEFPCRGVYTFGISRIYAADFLGLFGKKWLIGKDDDLQVVVYPKIDATYTMSPDRAAADLSALHFFNEPSDELSDLRDYKQDDDYRRIHWKLSSKRDNLIVKEYWAQEQGTVRMFLDNSVTEINGYRKALFEDRVLSHVASSINFCAQNRIPVELSYGEGAGERLTISPNENLSRIWHHLALLRFDATASALLSFCSSLPDRRMPVLFLTKLNPEVIGQLRLLNERARVLYFTSDDSDDFADGLYLRQLKELRLNSEVVTL